MSRGAKRREAVRTRRGGQAGSAQRHDMRRAEHVVRGAQHLRRRCSLSARGRMHTIDRAGRYPHSSTSMCALHMPCNLPPKVECHRGIAGLRQVPPWAGPGTSWYAPVRNMASR